MRRASRSLLTAEEGLVEREEKVSAAFLTAPFERRHQPWLMDQWYVNAAELAKPAIATVEDGRTRFVPERWSKTASMDAQYQPGYFAPAVVGPPDSAWYGADDHIFVEEDEAALAAAQAHYGKPVELRRDEDVLDTWFSGLWPFSTLGWPDETDEITRDLERYYPGRSGHWFRHHLLLGRPDDDDEHVRHGRRSAVPRCLYPRPCS